MKFTQVVHRHFVLFLIGSISAFSLCCHCESETSWNANDTSIETEDDELISELLETPIGFKSEHETTSDVSKILKILEVAEQATSTTMRSTTTTKTTTTTPKPSPFFKTERPRRYPGWSATSTSTGGDDDSIPALDEMMTYLNKSIQVAQQQLSDGAGNGVIDLSPVPELPGNQLSRRSDYYDLPADELLWHTAQAMWDVSSPVLSRTKPGRKISLIKETVKLPFRTFGAIKHKIYDLVKDPYGKHRRSYTYPWGGHLHHHSWGWDSNPVYVKYEPENSLFKLWLRFLYKSVKPAIITKIHFKKKLLRLKIIKLKKIARLVKLLKSIKLLKAWAIAKKIVEEIAAKFKPEVVVLKESGHVHGWAWPAPTTPPPPPPPAYQNWGWPRPQTTPPPGWGWSQGWGSGRTDTPGTNFDISYGPPEKNTYGQTPSASYGSPVAYRKENTYSNYNSPSDWLTAPPEQFAQGSDATSTKIDAPSYASHLREFGINPLSLSDAGAPSLKSLRQSSTDEDVPYVVPEDVPSDDKKSEGGRRS